MKLFDWFKSKDGSPDDEEFAKQRRDALKMLAAAPAAPAIVAVATEAKADDHVALTRKILEQSFPDIREPEQIHFDTPRTYVMDNVSCADVRYFCTSLSFVSDMPRIYRR